MANFFKHHVAKGLLLGVCACTLLACSALPLAKPAPPTVKVTGVRPVSLSLGSQTIGLTLLVANPNSFDLPMKSITFNANFGGERFAQGTSISQVVIPGNGEASLEVEVTTGLAKLATQLKSMLNTDNPSLDYDVNGLVTLSNWPKPIPFNVDGELEDPRLPAQ